MKKLYFLAEGSEPLEQLRGRLEEPVEYLGRYQLLSDHSTDQRRKILSAEGAMRRSDIVGLSWRGGFWAALVVVLCLAVMLPYLENSPLRKPVLYGLPLFAIAFGAWLGGLLGLMRVNPEYCRWQQEIADGQRLVAVAVPAERERMLRRQMADGGWRYLSQTLRYAGSYRFPQNRREEDAER